MERIMILENTQSNCQTIKQWEIHYMSIIFKLMDEFDQL